MVVVSYSVFKDVHDVKDVHSVCRYVEYVHT